MANHQVLIDHDTLYRLIEAAQYRQRQWADAAEGGDGVDEVFADTPTYEAMSIAADLQAAINRANQLDDAAEAAAKAGVVPVPAWAKSISDPQVVAAVTQELVHLLELHTPEDSRSFDGLCVETAALFMKRHASDDPHYWVGGERDGEFLDELENLCTTVRLCIRKDEDLINNAFSFSGSCATIERIVQNYESSQRRSSG